MVLLIISIPVPRTVEKIVVAAVSRTIQAIYQQRGVRGVNGVYVLHSFEAQCFTEHIGRGEVESSSTKSTPRIIHVDLHFSRVLVITSIQLQWISFVRNNTFKKQEANLPRIYSNYAIAT